ncbi:MAG: hypothetical protein KGJ77_08625 [Acidobacteriota bacterium]|nr:hypothetical protein [Acidobacteriota bacterium]
MGLDTEEGAVDRLGLLEVGHGVQHGLDALRGRAGHGRSGGPGAVSPVVRHEYDDRRPENVTGSGSGGLRSAARCAGLWGTEVVGVDPGPTAGRSEEVLPPTVTVAEVVRRFDLYGSTAPFGRCLECNGVLEDVAKAEVEGRLPPRTRQDFEEFRRCPGCGRVYWKGSHYDRLRDLVEEVLSERPPS